jgi:FtsP/CotA-like multicopper oxidase with cupredoxin domain
MCRYWCVADIIEHKYVPQILSKWVLLLTFSGVNYQSLATMARSFSVLLLTLLLTASSLAKDVTFNWNLGWVSANPDGRLVRPVIAINGQFPLPTINITLHDRIIINAVNDLGNTSATLHFHGIFQTGSNVQDGPYQVTQCGIPAGSSQTYNFTVWFIPFRSFSGTKYW